MIGRRKPATRQDVLISQTWGGGKIKRHTRTVAVYTEPSMARAVALPLAACAVMVVVALAYLADGRGGMAGFYALLAAIWLGNAGLAADSVRIERETIAMRRRLDAYEARGDRRPYVYPGGGP